VTEVPVPLPIPPAREETAPPAGTPPTHEVPLPPAPPSTTPWRDSLRRLLRNRLAVAGLVFLVLLVLACFAVPAIVPDLDPNAQDPKHYNEAPSSAHWFGRDSLGRDYLARVLVGGRTSLLVGLVGTVVCVLIGTFVGSVAGYFGGKVDDVLMRFVDFLYAIPYMFLVILIMLLFEEKERGSPLPVFAALGLVNWLTMARIVRGQVLTLRHQEYVLAARVTGASHARIILHHVLPNCLGPIIVYATLQVASVILLESFLSYLGLGLKLSWGVLVAEGVNIVNPIQSDWWLLLWPSVFLATTLLSLNFLGDGLRDAFDPRTRR
jgi:oligopeptide transport system permease protein